MENIKLSTIISDGMVLQRECENSIWGYARANDTLRLTMGAYQTAAKADERGYFELGLLPMKAGGPWQMTITDGTQTILLKDILFGDVFLLGGQSNMELPMSWVKENYENEYRYAMDEQIRMFDVPKEPVFGEKRELLTQGKWVRAQGRNIADFSAAGYFAAREIQKKEGIPIGLLQTAVGGTPVKAWCCEETIERLQLDAAEIEQCRDKEWVTGQQAYEMQRETGWIEEACAQFEEPPQKEAEGKIMVPGFFAGGELEGYTGSLRFTRCFELPEQTDYSRLAAKLYLGAITDADVTFINGKKVGETTYRYPPRMYEVPKGILHSGSNEIEIRMLVFRGEGAFMPGKKYELRVAGKAVVSLEGEWNCEVIKPMPYLPDMTFFQYKACGLYNGMLYPLRKQQVKGVFFYQGESNTGRPESYAEEFTQMVQDWRSLLKQPQLPFISVQLAGFRDGQEETTGINWALLRQAQLETEKIENTRMVQAYDLGEYNDLHPVDKKTVGQRIAQAADDVIYGGTNYEKGPTLQKISCRKESILVTFRTARPLCVHEEKNDGGQIHGFDAVFANGKVCALKAEMEGERTILLHLQWNDEPQKLRYAWNDCPDRANLFSTADLPAVPFEVEL